MATRSTITVRTGENERKSIYCHWDGYPSGVGKELMDNYITQESAEALIALGSLSELGATPDECKSYHLWRGEDLRIAVLTNTERVDREQFNYYWDGEKWTVRCPNRELTIEEAIQIYN